MVLNKNVTLEEAQEIGELLGINWARFSVEEFRKGLNVELEHGLREVKTNITGNDALLTGKIALAHLNELPDYYTRLKKLEEEAEKFWKRKETSQLA
jgi:hypothetical protein